MGPAVAAASRSKGFRPKRAARLRPPNPMPFRMRNSRRLLKLELPGWRRGELSGPKEQLKVEFGSIMFGRVRAFLEKRCLLWDGVKKRKFSAVTGRH